MAVHATGLADAKELLRARIDVFAHMISEVDDELVELFKQHPKTAVLLALGGPRRTIYAPWLNPPHPLVATGYLSVGCMPCTSRTSPDEDTRAGRWRP